ncbi:MAG TPA: DUF2335 domain-containing protein [Nannocystis exedens]|nr:DUF2335 domain-containing protein [Nannocystis exedens]
MVDGNDEPQDQAIARPSPAIGNESATISGAGTNASANVTMSAAVFSSGPLPHPALLRQYSEIDGAAEQILMMARREQDHRHKLELEELRLETKRDRRRRSPESEGS